MSSQDDDHTDASDAQAPVLGLTLRHWRTESLPAEKSFGVLRFVKDAV
jgi:hypothetical protein